MTLAFLSQLTGSFAMPAAENPTVVMIEAAYRQMGLDWRYINCEVSAERLGDAVRGARAMGWAGFNCSLPHKVAVVEHLDGLGESAKLIGAVNTVVRRDDCYIGENTDGKGFVQGLRELVDPAGKSVMIFGAGGAARAISVELALVGVARIIVVNRDHERAGQLIGLLNARTRVRADVQVWEGSVQVPPEIDIVINATSIGLFPAVDQRLNLDFDSLKPGMIVADCIPNPPRTHLVREASLRGCRVLDGLTMLVNQGVTAIRYWTGADADPLVMRRSLETTFRR